MSCPGCAAIGDPTFDFDQIWASGAERHELVQGKSGSTVSKLNSNFDMFFDLLGDRGGKAITSAPSMSRGRENGGGLRAPAFWIGFEAV